MIVKILKYDPAKGLGYFIDAKGVKTKFRYTRFAHKAVWAGQLGIINGTEQIEPAKWYHRLIWIIRRALWQLRKMI